MLLFDDLIIGKEYKVKIAYYTEKVNTEGGMYYKRGKEYQYVNCILTKKVLYDDKSMRLEVQLGNTFREFTLPVTSKRATGVVDIMEIE